VDENALHQRRKALAAALKEVRRRQNVTQVELADRLGEHQSYVSKYEVGASRLEFVQVEVVCRALQISLSELATLLEEYMNEI
jgi:transcriptional regulator with XRE-family HTH domain